MTPLSSEEMEPASDHEAESGPGLIRSSAWLRHADWIFSAAICLIILLFFFKTCFGGGSISRLCVLAEWDSVFDAWRTGRPQPYDPSLVQIFLPDFVFLSKNLAQGVLPFWNPYCGLGYPFVADIQSSVFAPLRFVFDFAPTLGSYNYFLIIELLVCGVSSYLLARELTQPAVRPVSLSSCMASLFAAVCYTFCPYNLWYLELNLGSSAALFPLTTLSFVWAARRRTIGSALVAGAVCGILILSGHPECSFFGITLAAALMVLLLILSPEQTPAKRILSALKILGIAGAGTVAVSAPVLFPFVEYLLNAESYKYGPAYSTPVTWNGILFNLSNPGQNGASPYLGIIAALAIPLSLLGLRRLSRNKKVTWALLILTGFCFLLVSQLGPVRAIFSQAPFTAIITRYALPYLLLALSLLAAVGLGELSQLCTSESERDVSLSGATAPVSRLLLIWLAAALLLLPALMFLWSFSLASNTSWLKLADFDAMLPATAWNQSAWRRDIICAGIFSLVSLFLVSSGGGGPGGSKLKVNHFFRHRGLALVTLALLLGFLSEASLSRLSLPLQSKFYYPQTELISKLQNTQFRTISTCEYVLRPATNAVYGINFLCVHNPLFPHRFLNFVKASGARTDVFNQKFDNRLSTLLNLASVKYVLTLEPIRDAAGKTSERFRQIYRSTNNIMIYENRDAAPRAYLVTQCLPACNSEESLKKIQSASFDATTTVVIESSETSCQSRSPDESPKEVCSGPGGYQQVKSLQFPNPNTVKISCQPHVPSWLVLTDIYYPGWQAYVDGKKTPIERANYAFRSVRLEPGNHEILFAYEPYSFYLGCGIFAAFAVLSAFVLSSGVYKRDL